jgi:hypothetical protein
MRLSNLIPEGRMSDQMIGDSETMTKAEFAKKYGREAAEEFFESNNNKRWKQTSMSPEAAVKEFGKENVRVKKGALNNGDDMVEVFVEGIAQAKKNVGVDPKKKNPCWSGKKLGSPKTKMKGGKEVPNCVPESTVNEVSDEEVARYKDKNPAMLKALRSIEATFGPERKKINDQVMAMMRTVSMLQSDRWKDRAFSNVESYGIDNVQQLAQEIKLMIADEKKALAADEEGLVQGIDTNIKKLSKALDELSSSVTEVTESVKLTPEDISCMIEDIKSDLSNRDLIDEHRKWLESKLGELEELSTLNEQQLNELAPLVGLAARAGISAAMRSAAGQAAKRAVTRGLKNVVKRVRNKPKRAAGTASAAAVSSGGSEKYSRNKDVTQAPGLDVTAAAYKAGLDTKDLGAVKKVYK